MSRAAHRASAISSSSDTRLFDRLRLEDFEEPMFTVMCGRFRGSAPSGTICTPNMALRACRLEEGFV